MPERTAWCEEHHCPYGSHLTRCPTHNLRAPAVERPCPHAEQTIVWYCPDCEDWGQLCDRTAGHAGPCGAPDCWLLGDPPADEDWRPPAGALAPASRPDPNAPNPPRVPWNVGVVLGDDRVVALRPMGSMNRIREADGHLSCWHDDATPCDRSGHETVSTYWIEEATDV